MPGWSCYLLEPAQFVVAVRLLVDVGRRSWAPALAALLIPHTALSYDRIPALV